MQGKQKNDNNNNFLKNNTPKNYIKQLITIVLA
jgi:hypothetical protein